MQTILGAGGAIGKGLAEALPAYTDRVRLVRRHPQAVRGSEEAVAADLLDADAVDKAVAGSDVVYLVAGLPYRTRVWWEQWRTVMKNSIAACRGHGARLVFFDNVYMYDRDHLGAMDEDTRVRPTSRKGEVRAAIAQQLMDAVSNGELEALIARSADFYGPGRLQASMLTLTVFERVAAGKSGQWLLSADCAHSFTFTPDASRGTAMLGNADDTWGRVWHLPTAANPPTGRGWIEAIGRELGRQPKVQVVSDTMLRLLGLFSADLRELREMAYQYDRDYVFSSERFQRRFGVEPTSYQDGIRAVIEHDYRDACA